MADIKTILCYGDSNTYGYNPVSGRRYDKNVRYTGRLAQALGDGFNVIEEGCNGRTTNFTPEDEPWKNGYSSLFAILNSHKPIDMVVLMLGSNDIKDCFDATAEQITRHSEIYIDSIRKFTREKQGSEAEILLVSTPKLVAEALAKSNFSESFSARSVLEDRKLTGFYEAVASSKNCLFTQAGNASLIDGLHMDSDGHRQLANRLAALINDHFEGR